MNIAVRLPHRVTADEFLAMPPDKRGLKQQLVDGEVSTMSPATSTHGRIQSNIARIIGAHLFETTANLSITTEGAVQPRVSGRTNVRVPDLIVSAEIEDQGAVATENPLIAIEVLSFYNERETRNNLMAIATIPSVQEIVVFLSTRMEVELLARDRNGDWPEQPVILGKTGVLELPSIKFSSPIAKFYERTAITD
jgi:Uma2 family endonuclease